VIHRHIRFPSLSIKKNVRSLSIFGLFHSLHSDLHSRLTLNDSKMKKFCDFYHHQIEMKQSVFSFVATISLTVSLYVLQQISMSLRGQVCETLNPSLSLSLSFLLSLCSLNIAFDTFRDHRHRRYQHHHQIQHIQPISVQLIIPSLRTLQSRLE